MRLLVALPPLEDYSPSTGGAVATVVEALARHWLGAGHEVVVVGAGGTDPYSTGTLVPLTYRWPEPRPVRRRQLGVVRRLRQYDWPAYPAYVTDVRRAARAHRPDWILLHNDVVLPAVLGRRSRGRAKVAVTLHNSVSTRRPDRALATLRGADVVTAVSHFIADEAIARFGLSSDRIAVVNNGVENALYQASARVPGPFLRVAFIGRLLKNKGPQVLLAAVERLRQQGVRVEVTIAGSPNFARAAGAEDAAFLAWFLERCAALGATYHPHLSRAEVSVLLAQQDVLVVPSLFDDPNPLVVLEGMASGCALVVSEKGGIPEAAGGAALTMAAGDDGALAEHLRRLAEDPHELRTWQQASLARARERDWRTVADEYLQLLPPDTPGSQAAGQTAGQG